MAEGRRIHGDGVENVQNYIEERLEEGTSTEQLAQGSRTLEHEMADLQALQHERGQPNPRPDIDALIQEAQLRVDRMSLRPDASQLEATAGSSIDFDKLPPANEARSQVVRELGSESGTGR